MDLCSSSSKGQFVPPDVEELSSDKAIIIWSTYLICLSSYLGIAAVWQAPSPA